MAYFGENEENEDDGLECKEGVVEVENKKTDIPVPLLTIIMFSKDDIDLENHT